MFESINFYLKTRQFALQSQFDITTNKNSVAVVKKGPKYHFNFAEKTGNALLSPIHHVFKKFDEVNYPIAKVALVIVGVFAAVFGLIGAGLKKAGEWANPNASIRQNALAKIHVIQYEQKKIENSSKKLSKIGELLNKNITHNILIQKKGAKKEELQKIYKELLFPQNVNSDKLNFKDQEPRLQSIKTFCKEWIKIMTQLEKKIKNLEECTIELELLKTLTADDREVQSSLSEYNKNLAAFINLANQGKEKIFKNCQEYNEIIKQIK